MPTTINGIGTHYYGKKNKSRRQGVCEKCHREAVLDSYDTRLFFVVVFIPVIPLGRKRIIDYCPSCTHHRMMPLDQYNHLVDETLSRLGDESRRKADDPETAIHYNHALLEFGRTEEAREHLFQITAKFPDDVRVNHYAGAAFDDLGMAEDAVRFYEKAFDLDNSYKPARRTKALLLISEDRLDEARRLLDFMMNPSEDQDPGALMLLAKAFQARGGHHQALEIFNVLARDFSGLAQDKKFRRAVEQSEAAASSPAGLLPKRQFARGKWAKVAVWLLIILAAVFGYDFYARTHRRLQVVSGWPGELMVTLDSGERVLFDGPGRRLLKIHQGPHRAVVSGPFEETMDFNMGEGLGERYSKKVRVLNPGGLAVLLRETTLYAVSVSRTFEPDYRFFAGENYLVLPRPDYVFEEFPGKIELSSGRDSAVRSRITDVNYPPAVMAMILTEHGDLETCLSYLERWLIRSPDDDLLTQYSSVAVVADKAPRAVTFLKNGLSLDPVNMGRHRAYQDAAMSIPGEDGKVWSEYDSYLGSDPENPDLQYLRGRIEADARRAIELFDRAVKKNPRHSFALKARAYRNQSRGWFAAAVDDLESALEASPGDDNVADMYYPALLGSGRKDQLEALLKDSIEGGMEEIDWNAAQWLAMLYGMDGRLDFGNALIKRLEKMEKGSDPDESPLWTLQAASSFYYAAGRMEELQKMAQKSLPKGDDRNRVLF